MKKAGPIVSKYKKYVNFIITIVSPGCDQNNLFFFTSTHFTLHNYSTLILGSNLGFL